MTPSLSASAIAGMPGLHAETGRPSDVASQPRGEGQRDWQRGDEGQRDDGIGRALAASEDYAPTAAIPARHPPSTCLMPGYCARLLRDLVLELVLNHKSAHRESSPPPSQPTAGVDLTALAVRHAPATAGVDGSSRSIRRQ